jgi:hypothetical protein
VIVHAAKLNWSYVSSIAETTIVTSGPRLEFFILTPLPGSEDYKVLAANGVTMDADTSWSMLSPIIRG